MCCSEQCAWCLAERGIRPDPRESHGICPRHAQMLLAEHAARLAAKSAMKMKKTKQE